MATVQLAVDTARGLALIEAQPIDMEVATDRLLPGQGFNAITGEQGIVNCIKYDGESDLTTVSSGQGQTVPYHLTAIDNFEELRSELNISAAATLGIGIYSGSVSANFTSSEHHTRFDSYLLIRVTVENPAKVLKKVVPTSVALHYASLGVSEFLRHCGNSYVYGFVTGGELLGLIRYSATTDEQASSVRLEVKAAAKGYGDGSFNLSQATSSVRSHSNTDVVIFRKGNAGPLPSIAGFVQASLEFPQWIASPANAALLKVLVRGYQTVSFPGRGIDLDMLEQQAQSLEILTTELVKAYETRNEIAVINQNRAQYDLGVDPDATINAALADVERTIQTVNHLVTQVRGNPQFALPAMPVMPNVPIQRPAVVVPRPPPPPIVSIYADINFQGNHLDTNDNFDNLQNTPAGDLNDQVSSLKVRGAPGQFSVQFFVNARFEGACYTVVSPAELGTTHFFAPGSFFFLGDSFSSMRIIRNF